MVGEGEMRVGDPSRECKREGWKREKAITSEATCPMLVM